MSIQPQQIDTVGFSDFLVKEGWDGVIVKSLSADMGMRRYYLLKKANKTALLMDMSRSGYEAHLKAYLDVCAFLKKAGVRVPAIYCTDLTTSLSIIEYFGEQSFGDARKAGESSQQIYGLATDVLIKIKQGITENNINLNGYKDTLIFKRLSQFVDFYMPLAAGRLTTQKDHEEFNAVWMQIEQNLPSCPMGFCHADYHLENLMWCPDVSEGYGLIDFQDAFWGFQGYDLLNLLEDARQTVPPEIKQVMKTRYCEGMDTAEQKNFDDWYCVLSAHFHCRVIGLFIKFSNETQTDEFLQHIPRLQQYIIKNLQNPVLAPLKEFVERHNIRLDILPTK